MLIHLVQAANGCWPLARGDLPADLLEARLAPQLSSCLATLG